MRYCHFLLLCIVTASLSAQITCSPANKQAYENKILEVNGLLEDDFGNTLVAIGKTFLGTPYVAKTLEVGDTETLVVNLLGLDCTTFVENVLALGLTLKNDTPSFEDFVGTLETLRYRDGQLNGYPSRLHYFTDWIRDNEEKGLVQDITVQLDGKIHPKPISFMGTHRELYPHLADDDTNWSTIKEVEATLSKQPLCVLPQDQIEEMEHLIQPGDIIALATSIKGLDVTHTGIATREADGRIHLLHASTKSMQVEISQKPLVDYLKDIKGNIGVCIIRPL
ncbi:MAG: N-acetylmuramoyl-L-alanine amidase-like domain-containing protein [Flavobacteriaceae bacterium]